MDILQGALAFAVAMIVFSTVVTGIVEVILRGLRVRPLLLIQAMEHYVEQYLQREMQRRGLSVSNSEDFDKLKTHIVGALVGNPAKAKVPTIDAVGGADGVDKIGRFSAVEDLSTYAFLQRLAKTEAGQELVTRYEELKTDGHEKLQSFLQDALRTFERYMATVNERFRIRSQRYAMIVALLVAFGFNISAGRLFTQLTTDTPLQQRLIVEAEQYADENFRRAAELNAQLTASNDVTDSSSAEGDAAQTASADAIGSAAAPLPEQTVKDLLARADALQQRSEELLFQSGLPVGPDHFPYNLTCAQWHRMLISDTSGVSGESSGGSNADTPAAPEQSAQSDDLVLRICAGLAWLNGTAPASDAAETDASAEVGAAAGTGNNPAEDTPLTRGNLLMWLINVVIAGFLIGLGGPFWYRVYSSLSNVAQVVRMLSGGDARPEVLTEKSAKLPATQAGIKEATDGSGRGGDLVSVFLTAAGPSSKSKTASPTDGTPAPQQGAPDKATAAKPV